MKSRTPLLSALAAATLALAGAAMAQTSTVETAPAPQAPPPIVTVRSVPPAAPKIAPPPAFRQLAGDSRWITPEQAAAYPPLANDFLNASRGAERLNQAQYEAWVKQLN